MYNMQGYPNGRSQPPPPPPPPLSMPSNMPQAQHSYGLAPQNSSLTPSRPPPPSPRSERSEKEVEEEMLSLPGPPPVSTLYDGKVWALDIVQQPVRARMCGFGDKDRRPISPPPCVRLIIMDPKTRQELDVSKIDLSFFVLTVDLWDYRATRETNLVKNTTLSPSISSVSTVAYPRTLATTFPSSQSAPQQYDVSNIPTYTGQNYSSPLSAMPASAQSYHRGNDASPYTNSNGSTTYSTTSHYSHDSRYGPTHHTNGYPQIPPISSFPTHQNDYARSPYGPASMPATPSSATTGGGGGGSGMYHRNLIGSSSASAFRLNDLEKREGIWFVLQDLSVRTEGWFRLKMNFVNIGQTAIMKPENGPPTPDGVMPQVLCDTTAPVLASVYSKPFHVWSAKRFPGVIESTPLSRTFAEQGIKIPIRKDGKDGKAKGKRRRSDDEIEDEASENEEDE